MGRMGAVIREACDVASVPPPAARCRLRPPRWPAPPFRGGGRRLDLRGALGAIFEDEQLVGLLAACGRPAERPWRLALVTLLRFAEALSDRRAAGAVRGRIVGPCLLGLELTGPRLRRLGAERAQALGSWPAAPRRVLLDTLLDAARERGGLAQARTAARRAPPRFWTRCGRRAASSAPSPRPAGRAPGPTRSGRIAARRALAERAGRDEHALLAAIMAPGRPSWPRGGPAAPGAAAGVWVQGLHPRRGGQGNAGREPLRGALAKAGGGRPPSLLMAASPCDPGRALRRAARATTAWIGCEVHLTETCEGERPPPIPRATTPSGPVADRAAPAPVRAAPAEKGSPAKPSPRPCRPPRRRPARGQPPRSRGDLRGTLVMAGEVAGIKAAGAVGPPFGGVFGEDCPLRVVWGAVPRPCRCQAGARSTVEPPASAPCCRPGSPG